MVDSYSDYARITGAASAVTTFDSYEDGDVYGSTETLSDYYSITKNLAEFSRGTGQAEGSVCLRFSNSNTNSKSHIVSVPGDGLPRYPEKGDTFAGLIQGNGNSADGDNTPGLIFGAGTGLDGYEVAFDPRDDWVSVRRIDGGSRTGLAGASPTLTNSTWYEFEIEWHDGTGSEADNTIVVNIYETATNPPSGGSFITSIKATDNTYATNKGAGVSVGVANISEYPVADFLRVTGSV